MRIPGPTALGVAALGAAGVLIFYDVKTFRPLLFFLALACLVLGTMLLRGFLGADGALSRRREQAREQPPVHRPAATSLPERCFRYDARPWGLRTAVGVFGLLGIALLTAAAAAGMALEGGLEAALTLTPLWGGGLLFLWLAQRLPRRYVRIDPYGVEALLMFRRTTIPWEDVIDLSARTWRSGGQPVSVEYRIASQADEPRFFAELNRCDELLALVSVATGLTWP